MSRQSQKEATRARLLEVAKRRFRTDGYEATTLAVVAREAGVAVGTVCAHFPDKPALVAAAFHAEIDRVVREASATLPLRGVLAQLLHLAASLYDWYASNASGQDFLRESMFATGEAEQLLGPQALGFIEQVAGLVEQASERGELVREVPALLIGQGFFADYLLVLMAGLKGGTPPRSWVLHLEALTTARLRGFTPGRSL